MGAAPRLQGAWLGARRARPDAVYNNIKTGLTSLFTPLAPKARHGQTFLTLGTQKFDCTKASGWLTL
jgi:hypothetical protein